MKLKAWLKEQHISDAEFAEIVSLSRVTINRLKRGVNRPSWPTMIEIERKTKGKVKVNDWL